MAGLAGDPTPSRMTETGHGPRRAATQEAAWSATSFIFKQADHVAYWQILFQIASDAAGFRVATRLRSLGRDNGGAGRRRLKLDERARLKEGAGAVGHDQQTAGQHDYVLQHEPTAA